MFARRSGGKPRGWFPVDKNIEITEEKFNSDVSRRYVEMNISRAWDIPVEIFQLF